MFVGNLKITTDLKRKPSGYFVFSTPKDYWNSPISNYPGFKVIHR